MRRMWLVALVGCSPHARVEVVRTDVRITVEAPGQTASELDVKVAAPLGVALASAHPRTISRDGVVTIDLSGTNGSNVANAIAEVALPEGMHPTIDTYAGRHVVRRYVVRSTDSQVVTAAKHAQWMSSVMGLPGVTHIEVCGEHPAVSYVEVDAQRLQAYGITIHDVRNAIETSHPRADALQDVVVGTTAGASVHLPDIAVVQVSPRRGGCLAGYRGQPVIAGEVWATKDVKLPPAPPGLEILDLPNSVELTVDHVPDVTRDVEFLAAMKAAQDASRRARVDVLIEDGNELRLLVPAPAVSAVLEALRESPGIVAHAPSPLVVTVFGVDRPQLIASANAIAAALDTRADGIIGLGDHDIAHREPDRPLVARANLAIEAVNDALAAASDTGLDLDLAEPTVLRTSALDGMTTAITQVIVGREPIELRRCGGMPCLKVRTTGNPDEITRLVKSVKLPQGMFWQLER